MYKSIEEFPNYKIDETGTVINSKGKVLSKQVNADGYFTVNLYSDGKYYHRRCARLVGLTFLRESYEDGLVINHKDFDRQYDHVDNLEWVTTLENNLHSIKGQPTLHTRDSDYSEDFIREVCKLIEKGERNIDIRSKLNITKDALLHLRCGQTWTWISKDYKLTPSKKGISEKTAIWVCHKLNEGLSYKEILKQATCNNLTIHILKKIKCKRSWTEVSKHILKD